MCLTKTLSLKQYFYENSEKNKPTVLNDIVLLFDTNAVQKILIYALIKDGMWHLIVIWLKLIATDSLYKNVNDHIKR